MNNLKWAHCYAWEEHGRHCTDNSIVWRTQCLEVSSQTLRILPWTMSNRLVLRSGAVAVVNTTMQFLDCRKRSVGGMYKTLELCSKDVLECRKQNLVGRFHGIRKSRMPREMWQWRPSARGFWGKDSTLPMSGEFDWQKFKSNWLMFLVGKNSKPVCSHAASWVLSAAPVWIVS